MGDDEAFKLRVSLSKLFSLFFVSIDELLNDCVGGHGGIGHVFVKVVQSWWDFSDFIGLMSLSGGSGEAVLFLLTLAVSLGKMKIEGHPGFDIFGLFSQS